MQGRGDLWGWDGGLCSHRQQRNMGSWWGECQVFWGGALCLHGSWGRPLVGVLAVAPGGTAGVVTLGFLCGLWTHAIILRGAGWGGHSCFAVLWYCQLEAGHNSSLSGPLHAEPR